MAFDPNEPRGPGGKWIHLGAIVDRLSGMREGERVTIKGHTIRRNIPRQTHRVIIGGETRDYKDVQHAAAAVHAGSHNEHGIDTGRAQNEAVRSMAAGAKKSGGPTPEQVLGARGGKLGQQRAGTEAADNIEHTRSYSTPARTHRTVLPASGTRNLGNGIVTNRGASGNIGVSRDGKRIGIVQRESNGSYSYEHKRGDSLGGFTLPDQAVAALVERDRAGESVGGRGESMRQYAGIGSAADERARARREIASIEEQLREMGQPASGYTARELVSQTRREDVQQQLDSGAARIWVKVPSGSEVSMSPETAKMLMSQRSGATEPKFQPPRMSGLAGQYEALAQSRQHAAGLDVGTLTRDEIHSEIARLGGYQQAAKTQRGRALMTQLQKIQLRERRQT